MLNDRLVPGAPKRFEFVEKELGDPLAVEPGFTEFLQDATLSGNVTPDEAEFLSRLGFKGKRLGPRYYYRELQNLEGPVAFSR